MKFTKYHSLNEILAYPQMEQYLQVFFSQDNLDMFPEETRHLPLALAERFTTSPWDAPFSHITDQLMDALQTITDIRQTNARKCISLWNPAEKWTPEKGLGGGKDSAFLLTPEFEKFASRQKRPAVIICPGGGYERVCFSGEGNPMMHYMEAKGYVTFVLRYRTAPERYPAPQEDLALAVRYVREHAACYGADPENIMLLGFSAGGHLCASLGCFPNQIADMVSAAYGQAITSDEIHPNKLCLAYPVISFGAECHEGSFQALTGGDEALRLPLSLEMHIPKDFPPTFLWACKDDGCVPPSNSIRMADALQETGIPHKLSLYPTGGHGCNLAFWCSAYSWTAEMLEFM